MMGVSEGILNFFRGIRQGALGFRVLLSLFLIVGLYLAISLVGNESSFYWPGWYILSLSPGTDVERAEEALRDMGVEETISAASADVAYMAIPDLERVSVANIDKYLIPGDPRRDSYISSVSRLFESNGSPLIYIRAKRGILHYKAILEWQREISDWRLMDWSGVGKLLNPLILIAVALLAALFGSAPEERLARFVSVIPLVVFVFLIAPDIIVPIVLAFYLSPNALAVGGRPYAHRIVICTGYAFALVSVFLTYDETYMSLLAVLASELVYLILAGANGPSAAKRAAGKNGVLSRRAAPGMRKSQSREHQLFNPVPLSRMYRGSGASRGTVFSTYRIRNLLLSALVFPVFLIPELAPVNHDPLPYAQRSAEKNFDNLEALELLDMSRSPTNLPDVSLLMASTAYQEGFPFGAVFRLPGLGDSLVIRNYSQEGDAMESVETTVIEYNRAWYKQRLSEQLGSGVGRLFASLDGPVPVLPLTGRPASGKGWDDSLTAILWTASFIAIFIIALISQDADSHMRNSTKPLSDGGRAQAA